MWRTMATKRGAPPIRIGSVNARCTGVTKPELARPSDHHAATEREERQKEARSGKGDRQTQHDLDQTAKAALPESARSRGRVRCAACALRAILPPIESGAHAQGEAGQLVVVEIMLRLTRRQRGVADYRIGECHGSGMIPALPVAVCPAAAPIIQAKGKWSLTFLRFSASGHTSVEGRPLKTRGGTDPPRFVCPKGRWRGAQRGHTKCS